MTSEWPAWEDLPGVALVLPIGGREYRVLPMGRLDEQRVQKAQEATREIALLRGEEKPDRKRIRQLEKDLLPDEEFLVAVLGNALPKMREDGVSSKAITHAGTVAWAKGVYGEQVARQLWTDGFSPEVLQQRLNALSTVLQAATGSIATASTDVPAKKTPRKAATRIPARSGAGS